VAVIALALVFDSGLLFNQTSDMSNEVGRHVASVVGVAVGVPQNEVNLLTSRITELEQELAARERIIAVSVDRADGRERPIDTSTLVLSTILFILLTLIVINYYLDYRRSQSANRPVLTVSNYHS
jgi:hypothetical protein